MRRLLPALLLVLLASPALAVITAKMPLKDVLAEEQFIFAVEVDKVDPDKPSVVFAVTEHLKGKAPFERLPVNLTGDDFAKKGAPFPKGEPHTKVMLDRLTPKRQAVFFVSKQGTGYSCFGFLEGTWFQVKGTVDGDAVRWAFLHCEPYFRRTFKGTTAELRTTVVECLAGKRKAPDVDDKEPPGYGPLPEKKDKPPAPRPSPLLAVIPSTVLIAPLALLAALFPGTAAVLSAGLKRWRAFSVIVGVNSLLALAHLALRELGWLPDAFAASARMYGVYVLVVSAVGVVWADRRHRDPVPPSRSELLALLGLTTLTGAIAAGTAWYAGWGEAVLLPGEGSSGLGKEFTAVAVGLAFATVYAAYRLATRPPGPGMSGETVGLAGVFLFGLVVLLVTWPRDRGPAALVGELGDAEAADVAGPRLADVRVWFETPDFHEVMSSVALTADRAYVGAARQSGFRSSGAVLALDRATGKEVWRFTNDGDLRPVFSTPAVSGPHVFVGEGLHTDEGCRVFRLDAAGKPAWPNPVTTGSHTEGSPRVVNGKAYFAAGDDGAWCVAADTGAKVWQLPGAGRKLHIDTPPAVSGGRVFVGSGYQTLALLGLDTETGAELWRTPVNLRSFGAPLALGDRVVFGLGTGNLTEDLAAESEEGVPKETTPAGAVVCLDAATGNQVWRYDLPKSAHAAPAADARTVYAACRDGYLYALDRKTGKLRWRRSLGSPLASGPAVAAYAGGALTLGVYAVSIEGMVACLHPVDGRVLWSRDLAAQTGRGVRVLSTPVVADLGSRRELYFGAMLTNRNNESKSAAVVRVEDVVE